MRTYILSIERMSKFMLVIKFDKKKKFV